MTNLVCQEYALRADIHSILITSKYALTERQIARDYSRFIGKPIDVQAAGFSTLKQFLTANSDQIETVVGTDSISRYKAANMAVTAHIKTLVSKQKTKHSHGDQMLFVMNRIAPKKSTPQIIPDPICKCLNAILGDYDSMAIDEDAILEEYLKRTDGRQ
ncbi:hypothetical protein GJ496_002741 [Pomphorhynchus laevis]|nr:hypothetical protein GJ496_002741 [Pomphorhynchus laevis]